MSIQPTPAITADQADAKVALGTNLAREGRRAEAVVLFREALRLRPDHAKAHHNLGVALAEENDLSSALVAFRDALRCQPDYAEAHHSLANTLGELGRDEEAIESYQRSLKLRADFVDALHNLGATLTRRGRPGEAVVFLQQALRLRPDFPEGQNNLGLAFAEGGDFAMAEACCMAALRLNPRYPDAHTNLGSVYKEQGKLHEAIACYEMALRFDPESASTHWNRALAWLQMGNFNQGWPEYEWRWRRKGVKAHSFAQPRWDGSPLQGKTILLHGEQGLGDIIQFLRYVPLVSKRGGKTALAVPASLAGILESCPGVDQIVAEGKEFFSFDTYAPMMSLPLYFDTTLTTIPADVPYIFPDRTKVLKWQNRLHDMAGFKVGIAWQGNPRHKWDRHRSFPLARMKDLASIDDVTFICLQKGSGAEQIVPLGNHFPVVDLGFELNDFTDTAAVIKCLDLVICCDSSVAHTWTSIVAAA